MYIVSVIITGTEHLGIGLVNRRFFREFVLQHLAGTFFRAVEQPAEQPESEDVATLQNGLVIHTAVGQSSLGHGRYRHFHNLGRDAKLLDWVVGGELGLFQAILLERVDVYDNHPARFQELVALLQCCGIHRHKHVALVARGVHTRTHAHLETAHAAERTLRGADFSRIVGERGNRVPKPRRNIGENVAGELHPVAGIA